MDGGLKILILIPADYKSAKAETSIEIGVLYNA